MILKIIVLSLIILFSPALEDISQAIGQSVEKTMMTVGKEQNGKEIAVKTGGIIQIELSEVGSAGYSWQMDFLDSQYLEPISEDIKRGLEKGKVGAPVVHLWRLKAVKPGQTEIRMKYYRKWEGAEKSKDFFYMNINIIQDRR